MSETINLNQFVNELANKYTTLYDVYRDEEIDSFSLPFMAIYRRRDERYMLSKKVKVYGVENLQLVFTSICKEQITLEYLKSFQQAIEKKMFQYIPNDNEHMSTIVVGITITDQEVEKETIKGVKRYRRIKFLKFGLHGWVEMYASVVSLKDRAIYVHPKGKPFVHSIEKMLKEEGVKS